ncbi:hypothetical protein DF027_23915 [Burkholderia cenocepacia]|nr:hypothetical protein DF028_27615 [Burkholderia cenocepacia]RQV37436.1 hypothetical protein DF027_23915 [Burkholderia cenocepacia]RQV71624.1 hypothetical protein DF010_26980 [Burkholderia cenocepacia]
MRDAARSRILLRRTPHAARRTPHAAPRTTHHAPRMTTAPSPSSRPLAPRPRGTLSLALKKPIGGCERERLD